MFTRWQRYAKGHPRVADAVLALLVFAISIPGSIIRTSGNTDGVGWSALVPAAIACAALLWRRDRPRAVLVVTVACCVVEAAQDYVLTAMLMGPLMVALYTLGLGARRKTTLVYALATAAVLVVTAVVAEPTRDQIYLTTVGPAAPVLLSALLGNFIRLRRAYWEAMRARAEHAERTREELARHRVSEERVRIARELHDVVAHHLALANAQAGTARHLLRTRPDDADKILADLAGTTSSALRELKATVGLLRRPEDSDAPLAPAPGVARLPDLTASFESAGLVVTVTTEGEPRPLSPGVDLTAFRITQEALTNVTKHAGTTSAHVRLSYTHDHVTVTVTDEGGLPPSAPQAANSGFGLIGMRERALSVGGRFHAGPRPEGGFEITAELPLHRSSP